MPLELTDKLRVVNFRNNLIAHIEYVVASWKKIGYEGDTEKVLRGFLRARKKPEGENGHK